MREPEKQGDFQQPITQRLPKVSYFVGSARKDIQGVPDDVKDVFGKSLQKAEWGGKARNVEPLKGFGSADVL